jgi:hypothetical protein
VAIAESRFNAWVARGQDQALADLADAE